jgi:hypothetical protein
MIMSNDPNQGWKKTFPPRTTLVLWLALAVFTGMLGCFVGALLNPGGSPSNWLLTAGILAGFGLLPCLLTIYVVIPLSRLLWQHGRQTLFGLACGLTLVALFYAEEDWRGAQAWRQLAEQWAAQGERFDMASVVPPPVPDDQNFAMTPLWVESMKATLGPRNAQKWFGDADWKNGRTNFSDRLNLEINRHDDWGWKNEPTNGSWAKAELTDLASWQAYYRGREGTSRHPAALTNEFPMAPQPQAPGTDVRLALSKYDGVIEELRADSQLPYARFPLDYTNEFPGAILLPHLAKLKAGAQVLGLRAVAELSSGGSEEALADVRLGLQLTDKIRTEPFIISHLVRLAMLQIMIQPVWEGLAKHQWTDAQLQGLENELAKLDFCADYRRSMGGEIAFADANTDYLRRHPEELPNTVRFDQDGNYQDPKLPGGWFARMIPAGWFYQNEYHHGRTMMTYYFSAAEPGAGIFFPDRVRQGKTVLAAEFRAPTAFNVMERLALPSLGQVAMHFAHGQATVSLARTGVALERYRLAHGEYPAALDALAPQFIAQVPHDVIGGQPLKYRRSQSGQFVLYSVGWNETDEGGTLAFEAGSTPAVKVAQGDWVWRYPEH